MNNLFEQWYKAAAKDSSGRFVHIVVPEDPREASELIQSAFLTGRHQASAPTLTGTEYDHSRLHDLVADGGFSVHPSNGRAPSSGFMASYDAPHGSGVAATHHINEIGPSDIADHRANIAEHLKDPGSYQGGWLDKGEGKVYLDASRHFDKEDDVKKFAVHHQQKAYFNLGDFEEHFVDPRLDPQAQTDHEGWSKKYKGNTKPAEGYENYAHRYPATPDQHKFWNDRGHQLMAKYQADRPEHLRGIPMGPWTRNAR